MSRRLGWLVVCFVLMLICAGFTSPLYPHYIGLDTSMLLTIAKGIVNGKIPYMDLFDHKGPVYFWIYAAGYFAGGRTGVFVLQCMVLFVNLLLLERIADLFHVDSNKLLLSYFALFFFMFEHGGLTEEFSMPLVLAGMYYELRFLKSGEEIHSPGIAFSYGLLLGLLSFIRLNNAIILCALLLCIMIILIRERQWKNLLFNLLCGLLGIAVIAVPVCMYFNYQGCMFDMLYGTFLHNLGYAKNNTHYPILSSSFLYFLILFIPAFYAMGVFWKKWRSARDRTYASLLFATVMTYAMLVYTNVYLHYFVLGIPLVITAAAADGGLSLAAIREKAAGSMKRKEHGTSGRAGLLSVALTGITVVYLLLAVFRACAPIYKTYLSDIALREYERVQEGVSVIPEEERDSVIAYNVQSDFYFHADIIPCYKYFTLQRWMTTEKVNVYREFMRFVWEEHPLWVVIRADEEDKTIRSILDVDYTCKWSDEAFSYYRYQDVQT